MSRNKASPFTQFLNEWNKEFGSMKEIDNDLTSHVGAPRFLIELTGDILKAIVLNMIVMYSITEKDSKYFYKSTASWRRTTTIKRTQLERIIKELEQENLIVTARRKRQGSTVIHYCLNRKELERQLLELNKELNTQEQVVLDEQVPNQEFMDDFNNLPF